MSHGKDLTLLISLLAFILSIWFFAMSLPTVEREHYSLTMKQQQSIVRQIGLSKYKEMVKDGCYAVIAEQVNTGVWVDYYCAEKYSKLRVVN